MIEWFWPSRLCAALVVLSLVVVLVGCATSTPTCDEASGLFGSGRLGEAAATFALARERGEGNCAQSGLAAVGNRYSDAYVEVAKGRVAEERRDAAGAVTAYSAALSIDAGNPAAKDALVRLQQPTPTLQPPPPRPPIVTSPAVSALVIWLVGAAVALLLGIAGLLAWAVVHWGGWTAERRREQIELRDRLKAAEVRARRADEAFRAELAEFENRVKGDVDGIDGRLRQQDHALQEMQTSLRALRTELDRVPVKSGAAASRRLDELEQHLDDVVDAFTEIVAAGGQPTLQRFVPSTPGRTGDADEQP